MTAWNLVEAREYVTYNAIDNEDFLDADDTAVMRFLNVAQRTLTRRFKSYRVPNEAVYLFAAVLAWSFNDVNKLAQQGQASFSVKGINTTFKDWSRKGLDALVPQEVLDIIADENGIDLKITAKAYEVTM